jgi:hypothetical protein
MFVAMGWRKSVEGKSGVGEFVTAWFRCSYHGKDKGEKTDPSGEHGRDDDPLGERIQRSGDAAR